MAAINHFKTQKGEDFQINWTIREGDRASDPVVNITGWTFSFKVKRNDDSADPSVVTPTITITDASNGGVSVAFLAAELLLLEGNYRHAFWRTNAGSKANLSKGTFIVEDTVEN